MRYTPRQWKTAPNKQSKGFLNIFKKKKKSFSVTRSEETRGWQRGPLPQDRRRNFSFPNVKPWILPLCLLAWIGLLVYLPYFRITRVSYFGLKTVTTSQMDSIVQDQFLKHKSFLPSNNYFLVSDSRIEKELLKTFSLNSATVKKVFPGELEVVVEEKVSSVIYDTGKEYYLLDQNGNRVRFLASTNDAGDLVFEEPASAPSSSIPVAIVWTSSTPQLQTSHVPDFKKIRIQFGNYPIVYWQPSTSTTLIDRSVVPPTIVAGVLQTYNALEEGNIAIVRYFSFDTVPSGITVYSNQPWKLMVDPSRDIKVQLDNVKLILRSNHPTDYIDVRFSDRVYWK